MAPWLPRSPLRSAGVAAASQRFRGGSLVSSELLHAGALPAAALPALSSLLALLALLGASRAAGASARGARPSRAPLLLLSLGLAASLAASHLLGGASPLTAAATAALFLVGGLLASLASPPILTPLPALSSTGETAESLGLRRARLFAPLFSALSLALAAPLSLLLALTQPAAASRPPRVPSSAIDGFVCAMRAGVGSLALGGAGVVSVDAVRALHSRLSSCERKFQPLAPPLIAAMALTSSPAHLFLALWVASTGLFFEAGLVTVFASLKLGRRVRALFPLVFASLASAAAVATLLPRGDARSWMLLLCCLLGSFSAPLASSSSALTRQIVPWLCAICSLAAGGPYGLALAASTHVMHSTFGGSAAPSAPQSDEAKTQIASSSSDSSALMSALALALALGQQASKSSSFLPGASLASWSGLAIGALVALLSFSPSLLQWMSVPPAADGTLFDASLALRTGLVVLPLMAASLALPAPMLYTAMIGATITIAMRLCFGDLASSAWTKQPQVTPHTTGSLPAAAPVGGAPYLLPQLSGLLSLGLVRPVECPPLAGTSLSMLQPLLALLASMVVTFGAMVGISLRAGRSSSQVDSKGASSALLEEGSGHLNSASQQAVAGEDFVPVADLIREATAGQLSDSGDASPADWVGETARSDVHIDRNVNQKAGRIERENNEEEEEEREKEDDDDYDDEEDDERDSDADEDGEDDEDDGENDAGDEDEANEDEGGDENEKEEDAGDEGDAKEDEDEEDKVEDEDEEDEEDDLDDEEEEEAEEREEDDEIEEDEDDDGEEDAGDKKQEEQDEEDGEDEDDTNSEDKTKDEDEEDEEGEYEEVEDEEGDDEEGEDEDGEDEEAEDDQDQDEDGEDEEAEDEEAEDEQDQDEESGDEKDVNVEEADDKDEEAGEKDEQDKLDDDEEDATSSHSAHITEQQVEDTDTEVTRQHSAAFDDRGRKPSTNAMAANSGNHASNRGWNRPTEEGEGERVMQAEAPGKEREMDPVEDDDDDAESKQANEKVEDEFRVDDDDEDLEEEDDYEWGEEDEDWGEEGEEALDDEDWSDEWEDWEEEDETM